MWVRRPISRSDPENSVAPHTLRVMRSHSRKSSGSPAGGQFTHRVRDDGVVVLYPPAWSTAEQADRQSVAYTQAPREFDPTADAVVFAGDDDTTLSLLTRFEDGELSQNGAEALAWNALAETWDVPEATAGRLPALAAHLYERRIMRDGGGVEAACNRYRANTQTDQEAEALFSPFNYFPLRVARRDAIVAALLRTPGVSDRLWQGALRYATQG